MEKNKLDKIEKLLIFSAFGILSGVISFDSYGFLAVFIFFILTAISLSLVINKSSTRSNITVLFLIFALLGSLRTSFSPEAVFVPEGKLTIEGKVSEFPDERDSKTEYSILVSKIEGQNLTNEFKVLVNAERFPRAEFGDLIKAEGTLDVPGIIEAKDGSKFDYGKYLRSQGFVARMSFVKVEILEKSNSSIKSVLFKIRKTFSDGIENSFPEPQSGFLKGIILGEKHAIGKDTEEVFQKAGLTHLVVLSGYNVMIVIGVILFIMRRISLRMAPYIAGITLLGFVIMTGAEEPAIRAGLMAGIMLIGLVLRKRYVAGRALALVIIGFTLWDPLSATSLSFLLSAVATFAVIYVAPIVSNYFQFITANFGLREATSTTIAAQVFVAPLILFSIGSIPVLSLIANVLVLPIMPLAMIFGAVAAVTGMFSFLPIIFAYPAHILLSYVIYVAKIIGSIPFAISLPYFPAIIVWFLYMILVYFSLRNRPLSAQGQ